MLILVWTKPVIGCLVKMSVVTLTRRLTSHKLLFLIKLKNTVNVLKNNVRLKMRNNIVT